MNLPEKDVKTSQKILEADKLRILRHDIYNQLSNIYLSVEQLRFEIPKNQGDCDFYLDSIFQSSAKINELLKETE